jgi:hypothetical protein
MTTYSDSLKLTLIGDGQESGTWGQTTNTNLGTLLEQAITGYVSISMADANVTLTSLNGTFDQARNAVIELTGSNTAVRDVIPPTKEKLYTIFNNTTGGYAVRVIGATGTGVNIPNGTTCLVYFNGTNFVNGLSGTAGSFTVAGTITATSTITSAAGITATTGTFSGAITSVSPTFTGTVTIPTPSVGSNTTVAASTAFVTGAIATATGSLGTMSSQNANTVTITGGTINGTTVGATTAANITGTTVIATTQFSGPGTGLTGNASSLTVGIANNGVKAWVNFDSAGTIANSYNVSSVTKNSTGNFTVNYTNALSTSSYAVNVSMSAGTNGGALACDISDAGPSLNSGGFSTSYMTTSSIRMQFGNANTSVAYDPYMVCVTVFA